MIPFPLHIRISKVIDWLTRPKNPANLALIYHNQPDAQAHHFGPFSDEVEQEIRKIDKSLRYMFTQLMSSNLADDLNVIILSDHGMAEVHEGNLTVLSEVVDHQLYKIYGERPLYFVDPNNGEEANVYHMLEKASKKNHFRVYRKQDIPDRFHYKFNDRILPIIIFPEENHELISDRRQFSADFTKVWGDHGYDNDAPSMRPFFFATGPAFKKGIVYEKEFQNIDLYPLMCKILDLPYERFNHNGSLDRIAEILAD